MTDEPFGSPDRMAWKTAVRESDLPPASKLILFVLESRMSVQCPHPFPSVDTLVADTGLARRTVQKHLGSLTNSDSGDPFVRKSHRFDHAGRQTSNEYKLVLTDPRGRVHEVHPGVHEMHGRGRIRCTGEGASDAPKEERRKKKEEDSSETWVKKEAWPVYLEELGGNGRQPSLTEKRRTKLVALHEEQLADEDDPTAMFRRVLRTVKASDHHMSKRSYQLPESLFANEERRERWVLEADDAPEPEQRITRDQLSEAYGGSP